MALPSEGGREGNLQGKRSLGAKATCLGLKATTFASWAASPFAMQSSCTSPSLRSGSGASFRLWSTLAQMSGPCSCALVPVRFSRPLGARCGLVEIALFAGPDFDVLQGRRPRLVTITSVIGSDFEGWLGSASGNVGARCVVLSACRRASKAGLFDRSDRLALRGVACGRA